MKFERKSFEGLSSDIVDILRLVDSNKDIILYIEGGQNNDFFKDLSKINGVNVLWVKSLLSGVFKIFGFIPSCRGLVQISGMDINQKIDRILDMSAGCSMVSVFVIKKTMVNHLSKIILNNVWEREISLSEAALLRFDYQDNDVYVARNY
jgi:hypothetical protein